jgi:hypothetical protein
MDFSQLSSRLGINRIDQAIEPYLEKIMKLVSEQLPSISRVALSRLPNSYALRFDSADGVINYFGMVFVSTGDPISQKFAPQSIRLSPMIKELKDLHPGKAVRLVDGRVILSNYQPEMDKYYEMADAIVRIFQVTCIPELRNAQILALTSNEFVVDHRISEARNAENQLSAHGVRPRMDVGMTLKAKLRNDLGREFSDLDNDYRLLGVIGGYTEIREREEFTVNGVRVMLYQPIFHITVCNSILPLEGVAAVMMAALAPSIYGTDFWATQWRDLSDGRPQPGFLEEDPNAPGRPVVLKDQDELLQFNHTYMAKPHISFQFLDGRDSIPGMWRMSSSVPEVKSHFLNRLTHFFAAPEEQVNSEMTRVIEIRYEGAYGDPSGNLSDSRDIDYLQIAAKNGVGSIDQAMRRTLLSNSDNSTDRARIVSSVTGNFMPLYLSSVAVVNPDFFRWIVGKTDARGMVIVDPNHQTAARSIGSFTDGFGSQMNIGTVVSSGQVSRGLGLSSVWAN